MIAQINVKTRECRLFDIRKLSTRECGRLMNVPEKYLDVMLAPDSGISNSAAYKLFGNSICCGVLMHIYEEALYPTGRRLPTETPDIFARPQFRLERDWTKNPFRLISLCSGFDSQAIALDMLAQQHPDFRWTLTAWSEFDPESSRPLDQQPAVVAHRLCFPNAGPNLGDMTRIDWQDFMQNPQKYYDDERERTEGETAIGSNIGSNADTDGNNDNVASERMQARNGGDDNGSRGRAMSGEFSDVGALSDDCRPDRIQVGDIDLLTYSTPCQSISQAGKREGMAKGSGTRSSVLWSTADAIEALRPKMLLQENVRAIINQQNIRHFRQWMQTVSDLGYENFLAPSFTLPGGERTTASILNARDYGIPQNRDRMFLVSIRKDLLRGTQYEFPRPFPLTRCIADVLEPDASPALYLKPESVTAFLQKNEDGQQQYIYATVSHRPTSTQIDALIAEHVVRMKS